MYSNSSKQNIQSCSDSDDSDDYQIIKSRKGFAATVKVSMEFRKFAVWDDNTSKSIICVTRFICKYIKDNNLQNPYNAVNFFPDKKLAKLLRMEVEHEYCYINLHKYLEIHMTK